MENGVGISSAEECPSQESTRLCNKCKELKPTTAFGKQRKTCYHCRRSVSLSQENKRAGLVKLKQRLRDLNKEANLPIYREGYLRVLENPNHAIDVVQDVFSLLVLCEQYRKVANDAINSVSSIARVDEQSFIEDYAILMEEINEVERNYQTEI